VAGRSLIESDRHSASPPTSSRSAAVRARLDLLGLALAGALVGWTYFGLASPGRSSLPFLGLLLASASALVVGRLVASVRRPLIPAVIVGAAAVLAVSTPDVLSSAPLSGPFGYSNAKGAFFLQAAIAGLMLATVSRSAPGRFLGVVASIAFGLVPFVVESLTPAVLVFLLPIAALAPRGSVMARAAPLGCGLLFVATLSVTIALGAVYTTADRSGLVDRVVDSTLSQRRAALWHEALVIMGDHPIAGVGVGGFEIFSPTARSDPDARWAHNSFLQQGAETGVVGLILLLLLFVWGFARLGAIGTPDAFSALGAVALAALGIHACVDYILHFPAVPLTAAALVGAAGASQKRRRSEYS
jgi:O-antigen ligase